MGRGLGADGGGAVFQAKVFCDKEYDKKVRRSLCVRRLRTPRQCPALVADLVEICRTAGVRVAYARVKTYASRSSLLLYIMSFQVDGLEIYVVEVEALVELRRQLSVENLEI